MALISLQYAQELESFLKSSSDEEPTAGPTMTAQDIIRYLVQLVLLSSMRNCII